MTFIKLDDGYGEHPKIVGLSDRAYRLYVNGLCYCSRRKTDGYLPGLIPRSLIACSAANFRHALDELEHSDLWERDFERNGWIVRDYLKHQRSREQIETEQAAARTRWQRFRNGQPTDEQHSNNGVANGDTTGELQTNLVVSEVRGQRSEVKVRGTANAVKTIPPNPPDGGNAAERARKGSKRKRDVDALKAEQAKMTPEERYLGKRVRR